MHPCSTSDVGTVIKKVKWLKSWLKTKAPDIEVLKPKEKPAYHWIATGGVGITKGSKYERMLALNNIQVARLWNYSKIAK